MMEQDNNKKQYYDPYYKSKFEKDGKLMDYLIMKQHNEKKYTNQVYVNDQEIWLFYLPDELKLLIFNFIGDNDVYKLIKYLELTPDNTFKLDNWNYLGFITGGLLNKICECKNINIMFSHCRRKYIIYSNISIPLFYLDINSIITYDNEIIQKYRSSLKKKTSEEFSLISLKKELYSDDLGSIGFEFLLNHYHNIY